MPYEKSNKSIQDSAFKMKGFSGFGNESPAKHKMKAHPRYHGAGGAGWTEEVTDEEVKAHDAKYGEGHTTHKRMSRKGRHFPKIVKED